MYDCEYLENKIRFISVFYEICPDNACAVLYYESCTGGHARRGIERSFLLRLNFKYLETECYGGPMNIYNIPR